MLKEISEEGLAGLETDGMEGSEASDKSNVAKVPDWEQGSCYVTASPREARWYRTFNTKP